MNLPDQDHAFLRDLVKAARQKTVHVTWVDRDGSHRHTSLSQAEAVRLNTLAQQLGTSKQEVLRRAAHIPVGKSPEKKPPLSENGGGPAHA